MNILNRITYSYQVKTILSLLLLTPLSAQVREWTSTDGNKIKAEFISRSETTVKIKRDDGVVFNAPIERFSESDRTFILSKPVVKPLTDDRIIEIIKEFPSKIKFKEPLSESPAISREIEKYKKQVEMFRVINLDSKLPMIRMEMKRDFERYEEISKRDVSSPTRTLGGWSGGGPNWQEVYAARAFVGWLRDFNKYLGEFEG